MRYAATPFTPLSLYREKSTLIVYPEAVSSLALAVVSLTHRPCALGKPCTLWPQVRRFLSTRQVRDIDDNYIPALPVLQSQSYEKNEAQMETSNIRLRRGTGASKAHPIEEYHVYYLRC